MNYNPHEILHSYRTHVIGKDKPMPDPMPSHQEMIEQIKAASGDLSFGQRIFVLVRPNQKLDHFETDDLELINTVVSVCFNTAVKTSLWPSYAASLVMDWLPMKEPERFDFDVLIDGYIHYEVDYMAYDDDVKATLAICEKPVTTYDHEALNAYLAELLVNNLNILSGEFDVFESVCFKDDALWLNGEVITEAELQNKVLAEVANLSTSEIKEFFLREFHDSVHQDGEIFLLVSDSVTGKQFDTFHNF